MASPADPRVTTAAAAPASTAETVRRERVREVFAAVAERERSAREDFLRDVAAADPRVAEEARELLRDLDEAATAFLGTALASPPTDLEGAELAGRTVGGYRLTRPLGQGGMGTVWEAIRDEDGKRVAIKLLRWRGHPAEVATHVRAERRTLAALEHDNIARLIDGGISEQGLPYFTMEFVDGREIDDYCADEALDLRARLRLFRTVCGAVEYAHRRLVIHCDIKPANILVTADGVPKLLDFGIARPLRPGDAAGADALPIALTPEYAAPEQVRGEPVTTATDVYALGLLLYELLTGRRAQALQSLSPDEIVRVVCSTQPPRPSTVARPELRRGLGGDLDAIVLRALRKEPGERYGSARELADDVGRHLRALPVEARAGGVVYRSGRFLRRHRAALVAGGLVAASLVGGTVAALREAHRAQRRFADVRHLATSFLFEFHDAIRDLPGATPARRLLVGKALVYLDSLAREARGDVGLERELATAYQRVGDVQGYTWNANLGDTPGALRSYEKSVALAEEVVAERPQDADARRTLAGSLERLGTMRMATANSDAARQPLARARSLLEALHRERPRDPGVAHGLHVTLLREGQLLEGRQATAALADYRAAQRLDADMVVAFPGASGPQRDLSVAEESIARLLADEHPDQALRLYQAMLPVAERLAAAEPNNAQLRRDVLVGHNEVARMLDRLGRYDEALAQHRQALAIGEELLRADPANLQALQDLSSQHSQIGDVLLHRGETEAALASYGRSLAIDAQVAARDPSNAKAAAYLGWSHVDVASVLQQAGRTGEALEHLRQAIALATPLAQRDAANADLQSLLAEASAGIGEALLAPVAPGRPCPAEGRAALARAVAIWDGLRLPPGPDRERRDRDAARVAECGATVAQNE